jgi:hypothetical protein
MTNYNRKCREYVVLATNPRAELKRYGAQRGDLVTFEERGYRNENLWIFDGTDIIRLDDIIDDYGALPYEFTINEGFSPTHWSNPISIEIDGNGVCTWTNEVGRGFDHSDIVHIILNDENVRQLNAIPRTKGKMCNATIVCNDQHINVLFGHDHEFVVGLIHGDVDLITGVVDLSRLTAF